MRGHWDIKRFRNLTFLLSSLWTVCSCSLSKYAANPAFPVVDSRIKYKGILEECMYDCSVKGPGQRRMFVYLPGDYYENDTRYPVLYLLHGARGNELSWIVKGNLLGNIDSLTSSSMMKETIVVLPNLNQYKDDRDFGKSRLKSPVESFFETDGMVESAFMDDVVATIDSLYRTMPDKKHRSIAGLSIGAMQAMYISANSPDAFDYVGMFSSIIRPALGRKGFSSFYKGLEGKLAVQFRSPPELYMLMIGRKDLYYPRMKAYARYLERMRYPFVMYVTDGGHEWYNWEPFANIFMQKLWK